MACRLALVTLEGASRRAVRLWKGTTWTELAGLPAAGDIGIASLLVDRERIFYLEFQTGSGASVLWMHDGSAWQEWARSDPSEGFHGLVMHGGVLYTMFGDAPNEGLPKTMGIARLDRGRVTRQHFDTQSAAANIDPDSRHDVMSLEQSGLVSRGDNLWLYYEEGPSGRSTIRLYRHAPRVAR